MGNQLSDGWEDRQLDGKIDRQKVRLTERLMEVIAKKKISQIMFDLRHIYYRSSSHLEMRAIWKNKH